MRKILVLVFLLLGGLTIAGTAAAAPETGRIFTVQLLPSGDPDGSGTATIRVNPGTGAVCYSIEVTGIDEPQEPAEGIGSGHIHVRPSGGIAVDLNTEFVADGSGGFESSGCVTAERDLLIEILRNPELYYLNVHTGLFPTGAVQGDLA